MPEAPVNATVIVREEAMRGGRRSGLAELAVPYQHRVARRERAGEALRKIDGPMLAPGAADRHRQIVAVVAYVVRQPACDEMVDVRVHALHFGDRLEKLHDVGILAAEGPQRR